MLKTQLSPDAVSDLQSQIRADPTPVIVEEEKVPFDKLASNKAGRDRLRDRGGRSTTVNLRPESCSAIAHLIETYEGIDTATDAIDAALRWLIGYLATAPKTTLHIGGSP